MKYRTHTALSTAFLLAACAHAEWHYGIGSGIGASSYDGDLKFANAKLDVEYDQDDFEGGFGAAGFATDGTWVFQLSGSSVEYESKDTINGTPPPPRTTNNFQKTYAEFTAGYVAYREGSLALTPYLGVNYTEHEWEFKGTGTNITFDDSWIDAILGLQVDYLLNAAWTWNNSVEYTVGDSEGCMGLKTGVSWKFAEHWVTSAYFSYESDEFEGSDRRGDFNYDADVTTFGLTLMYTW